MGGCGRPAPRLPCYSFSPDMKASDFLIECALVAGLCSGFVLAQAPAAANATTPTAGSQAELRTPEEKHLRNVRQLTFGGSNAEAYFSADGKKLIFQSTRDSLQRDQIGKRTRLTSSP